MKTLTVTLPDALTPQQEHDLEMEIAGLPCTGQLLTSSEATALVGIERGEFTAQLGHYGYSLAGESIEQFADEVADARCYIRHHLPDFSKQNRAA